jgi:hypothetical protein
LNIKVIHAQSAKKDGSEAGFIFGGVPITESRFPIPERPRDVAGFGEHSHIVCVARSAGGIVGVVTAEFAEVDGSAKVGRPFAGKVE